MQYITEKIKCRVYYDFKTNACIKQTLRIEQSLYMAKQYFIKSNSWTALYTYQKLSQSSNQGLI